MTVHRPTTGERLTAFVREALEAADAPPQSFIQLDDLVERFDKAETKIRDLQGGHNG